MCAALRLVATLGYAELLSIASGSINTVEFRRSPTIKSNLMEACSGSLVLTAGCSQHSISKTVLRQQDNHQQKLPARGTHRAVCLPATTITYAHCSVQQACRLFADGGRALTLVVSYYYARLTWDAAAATVALPARLPRLLASKETAVNCVHSLAQLLGLPPAASLF